MKKLFILFAFVLSLFGADKASIYDFSLTTIDNEKTTLQSYKGKVLLIVNVASKCRFTNQYEGLELLYQKYKDKGLVVLAFPSNQFGAQEPWVEFEIKKFCTSTYHVTFPMFAKIDVNGDKADPLYTYLKKQSSTGDIQWNFTKFLINKEGAIVNRFTPETTPETLEKDILKLL